MDLTEEKVSFDQMPTVVSELKQEISGLKTLVRTLIDAAGAAPKDAWMNIDELRAYHPDHPARPTIEDAVIRTDCQSGNAGLRFTAGAKKVVNYDIGNQKKSHRSGTIG